MLTLTTALSQDTVTILTVIGTINSIISTIACPVIAARKGRSVGGWIFGGFVLGLIGLIIVALLPDKY